MAALTQDIRTKILGKSANGYHEFPAAVDVFYEGALIAVNVAGYAAPVAADTNNGRFLGVCMEKCDNSGGSAGDKKVRVSRGITYVEMSLTGAVVGDAGELLYSATDNPDDCTKTSTTATLLGTIVMLESGTKIQVKLEPDL